MWVWQVNIHHPSDPYFSRNMDFNDDGKLDPLAILATIFFKGKVESFGWLEVTPSEFLVDGVLAVLKKVPTLRTLEIEQLSIKCFRKDTCSCLKGVMSRLTALRLIECDGFETLANAIAEGLTCTTSLIIICLGTRILSSMKKSLITSCI